MHIVGWRALSEVIQGTVRACPKFSVSRGNPTLHNLLSRGLDPIYLVPSTPYFDFHPLIPWYQLRTSMAIVSPLINGGF